MKLIIVVIVMLSVSLGSFAGDGPLFPDGVNQILGRIQPGMSEAQADIPLLHLRCGVQRS